MRLSGFASGMDIDQIVGDLMRAERVPMDKMVQKRQTLEWQMEEYRSINRLFDEFRNNIFDTVMRKSKMGSRTASSSDENRITATASSAAGSATYQISNVTQLATAASQTSIKPNENDPKIDPTKSLKSQFQSLDWKTGGVHRENLKGNDSKELTIKNEGLTIKNDTDNMVVKVNGKLYKMVDSEPAVNTNEVKAVFSGSEMTLTFADAIGTKDDISVQYFTDGDGEYMSGNITTYNENGEPVKDKFIVESSQTLNQVLETINRSSVGVSAFYDDHTGQVAFTRSETGEFNKDGQEIEFGGKFFGKDEQDAPVGIINMSQANEQGGQNAKFTINGLATERHSNTFTINGMTISLKDTFDSGTVTIGSSVDTDAVFDTIKGFVEEYNEMLDTINEKLDEKRYRDYQPLTDEQKKDLSDREIELWEEKSKSGMIRNDRLLSGFMNTFRLDLYGSVDSNLDSEYKQLTTIGVTTTKNYMDRGKLKIDENKLRKAIEDDPDGVYQLFAADGPTKEQQGIARRMRQSLDQAIEGIAERAGGAKGKIQNHQFTLGRNLNNLEDQISNFERRLSDIENRYWRQFTAMEKAMARANEQASFLQQQMFGGGGGY
ncbi:flagellar filament capping protein FliD [Bacillus piscicola]|uniref:flagellar filament capping protein FliD n=1 Tax=Bacillus piscicola TaxID=1632684 RepID=UPI001F09C433|nr:flagellar filament capping protein FliD [Bacillus piscicola]